MKMVIANTEIDQDAEGRFSLNDLHRASGGGERHKPANFLRLDQTQALILEISNCSDVQNKNPVATSSGRYGGSHVCKEMVYAYAMWISPKFHLQVIRTFDEVATGKIGTNPRSLVLSPTQQLAAGREIRKLAQEIKRETNPALRRMLHAQLGHHCGMIAIPAPALEEIGQDAVPDHESPLLEEFWDVVDTLQQAGAALDHARDKTLIALNVPQVRAAAAAARLALPDAGDLHRLLRACRSPRFLAVKAVNSVLDTTTVKCWMFERPNAASTLDLFP